jgi:hypothetical protein
MNAFVRWILRTLFPYRIPPGMQVRSLNDLRAEYQSWEAFASLPFVAFALAIGGLCFLSLQSLVRWHAFALGPSRFVLMPSATGSALAAMFLGMILAFAPVHFLYKALLRERYQEYTVYCNLKFGFDTWKSFAWLAALIIVVAGIVIAAELTAYTQVTDQAIIVRGPLSPGARTHALSEIESITAVAGTRNRRGEFMPDPYHIVRFKDETTWSTRDGLQNHRSPEMRPLIAFLAQASGKGIQEVQVIGELKR